MCYCREMNSNLSSSLQGNCVNHAFMTGGHKRLCLPPCPQYKAVLLLLTQIRVRRIVLFKNYIFLNSSLMFRIHLTFVFIPKFVSVHLFANFAFNLRHNSL